MWLRKYRMFINNLRHKVEMAKGDNSYLINAVADVSLLEKLIRECNNDSSLRVKIILIDGTELRLETTDKQNNKSINWEN